MARYKRTPEANRRRYRTYELRVNEARMEMLGARLNTLHNLHYYQELMQGLRGAIESRRLAEYLSEIRQTSDDS